MYKETNKKNDVHSAIIKTHITDHYSIAIKIKLDKAKIDKQKVTKIYTKVNFDKLTEEILKQEWSIITESTDVDFAAEKLTEIIQKQVQKCTEMKKYTNKLTPLKPWMTIGILKSIRNRDNLALLSKKYPNNHRLKDYYKKVRNIVCKVIKTSKNTYFKDKIEENKDDKKKMWQFLKEFIDKKKNKSTYIKTFNHNNIQYNSDNEPIASANVINKYFIDIGKILAEKIANSRQKLNNIPNIIKNQNTNSNQQLMDINNTLESQEIYFKDFKTTNTTEVYTTIMSLKNNSCPGYDNVNSRILKHIAHHITIPLTHIIKLSLKYGIFPASYKLSTIVPVFKKGN